MCAHCKSIRLELAVEQSTFRETEDDHETRTRGSPKTRPRTSKSCARF
jgi:hypothetical protein